MNIISWSRSIKTVAHGPAAQIFCLGLYSVLKISEPVFKIGRFHIKKNHLDFCLFFKNSDFITPDPVSNH